MRFCIFGSNPMLWKEGLSWKSVFPKYYVLTYFLPKHKIVDPRISGCSNSPQRVLFGFISYSPTNDPPAFVFPLDFSPFINPFVVSLFVWQKCNDYPFSPLLSRVLKIVFDLFLFIGTVCSLDYCPAEIRNLSILAQDPSFDFCSKAAVFVI